MHDFTHNYVGKALGLNWNISEDTFVFPMRNLSHGTVTCRSMLSFVASIFDPIGLVTPWVLPGKLLLQEATHLKLDWDQSVPANIQSKVDAWVSALGKLREVSFPHCVKPLSFDGGYYEYHIFADERKAAYGACTYLRCINTKGEISCQLMSLHSANVLQFLDWSCRPLPMQLKCMVYSNKNWILDLFQHISGQTRLSS